MEERSVKKDKIISHLSYEELYKMIHVDNLSYIQIGKMMNCSDSNVKNIAKKMGIPIPSRRKINPSESLHRRMANPKKRKVRINKIDLWLSGKWNGACGKYGISDIVRNFLIEKAGFKCEICGWNKLNIVTKKSPLQIHHKDGDCMNNNPNNLIVLCPNCHSLTENFGFRNKKCPEGKSDYFGRVHKVQ